MIGRHEALRWLVERELIEMGSDGKWRPTPEGRLLVAAMKRLQEIDEETDYGP